MTSAVAKMSKLEQAARRAWLEKSVDQRYGVCAGCGEPKFVARQANHRRYECLDCWDVK